MNNSTDRRRTSRIQTPGMILAAWLAVAVLFLVTGGLALVFALSASADNATADEWLAELEVIALQDRLVWLHHDLLVDGLRTDGLLADGLLADGLLAGGLVTDDGLTNDLPTDDLVTGGLLNEDLLGDDLVTDGLLTDDLVTEDLLVDPRSGEISPDRVASFRRERAKLVEELGVFAASDGPGASAARELVEISGWDSFDGWPYSPESLDNQHYSLLFFDRSATAGGSWLHHNEAASRSMLAQLVLVDALSVANAKATPSPDAWGTEFQAYTFETVIDAPGWLGPDRQDPLANNFVSGSGRGGVAEVPGSTYSVALAELQQVWDYDQWLINNADQGFTAEPPMSVEQLERVASAATDALRRDALNAIAADIASIDATRPRNTTVIGWYSLAAAVMVLAVISFGMVFAHLLGGHRKLAETALTDALTGARNRRFLDTEVAGRCQRTECNHLIVMVDLDRFKLINDTWGHDAGDALLRLLSSRLENVVSDLAKAVPGLTAAVMRPGGDEFIVAIHSTKDVSATSLEERLRAITGPVDLGRDELIDLQFSLGIACVYGAADLADLVKAADLAAYEDKRRRADARKARVEMAEHEVIEIL